MSDSIKRPWCCPEPRCIPVFQIHDREDNPDLTIPVPAESYFCFGEMGEPVTFIYDGHEHKNDLNSCAYTPLKGVIRWQENEDDWQWLEIGYRRAREKLKERRAMRAIDEGRDG